MHPRQTFTSVIFASEQKRPIRTSCDSGSEGYGDTIPNHLGTATVAAAGLLDVAEGSTEAIVAGGALAAAAGSIVSQGVGLATGIQSKFNWDAVGEAAVSAGVGAGLSSAGVFDDLGIGAATDPLQAFAQGAISNALTQGIEVGTGLQKQFDWAGVAGAGIGQALGAELGAGASGNSQAQNLGLLGAGGMAGAIASATLRTAFGDQNFGANIGRYLPNAIGQTIGNEIGGEITQSTQPGANGGQFPTTTIQPLNIPAPTLDSSQLVPMTLPSLDDPDVGTDDAAAGNSNGDDISNVPVPIPRPDVGDLAAARNANYSDDQIGAYISAGDHYVAGQGWLDANGNPAPEIVVVNGTRLNQDDAGISPLFNDFINQSSGGYTQIADKGGAFVRGLMRQFPPAVSESEQERLNTIDSLENDLRNQGYSEEKIDQLRNYAVQQAVTQTLVKIGVVSVIADAAEAVAVSQALKTAIVGGDVTSLLSEPVEFREIVEETYIQVLQTESNNSYKMNFPNGRIPQDPGDLPWPR